MVHSRNPGVASLSEMLLSAFKLESPNKVKKILRKILHQKIDLNIQDEKGYTALHYAVELNNITIIKSLLKAGSTLDKQDCDKNTPLHFAVRKSNNSEVVKLLLDAGAEVNITNLYSESPLHIASAQKGNSITVKLLLDARSAVGAEDQDGNIPLQCAVKQRNNTKTIKLLLSKTPNLNHQNKYGDTALHYVVLYNNLKNFDLLACNGADINIRSNKFGDTPLELALKRSTKDVRWSQLGEQKAKVSMTEALALPGLRTPFPRGLQDKADYVDMSQISNIFSSLTLLEHNVYEPANGNISQLPGSDNLSYD